MRKIETIMEFISGKDSNSGEIRAKVVVDGKTIHSEVIKTKTGIDVDVETNCPGAIDMLKKLRRET